MTENEDHALDRCGRNIRCCDDGDTHTFARVAGATLSECRHGEVRQLCDPVEPPLVELGQGRDWDDDRGAWLAFCILAALGVVIFVCAMVLHP